MIEEHKTTYYIRGSPFIPRSKDTWVFWRHGDRLAPVDGTAPPSSGSKPAIILLYETGINGAVFPSCLSSINGARTPNIGSQGELPRMVQAMGLEPTQSVRTQIKSLLHCHSCSACIEMVIPPGTAPGSHR